MSAYLSSLLVETDELEDIFTCFTFGGILSLLVFVR